ncbi:T9SS type A sorting domain-containing protein [bacterium]|nr:T9SS type A sorting domain-containing protein [bacterium]
MKTAGTQTITFNGKDLPSGIYLYRLETDDFAAQKKMLLLK